MRIPYSNYWKDWNNFTKELYPVIENEYMDRNGTVIKPAKTFPLYLQLDLIGRRDLQYAIRVNGGINAVREKLSSNLTDINWDNHKKTEYYGKYRFSKEQYSRAIVLLETTNKSLTEIGHEIGLNYQKIAYIQNREIREGTLDQKHRRLRGLIQWQYDRALELLQITNHPLQYIAADIGKSIGPVSRIQTEAITAGELNPKSKRLGRGKRGKGIVQGQYDEALELLQTTDLPLQVIASKAGVSGSTVMYVQNTTIQDGRLGPGRKRLKGGVIQEHYDTTVELLRTTELNLTEIEKKVGSIRGSNTYEKVIGLLSTTTYALSRIEIETGVSRSTIRNIQNRAIAEGGLDPKYRRLAGGVIQGRHDKILELLKNTDWSLTQISREAGGVSVNSIIRLQNKAIVEGSLDSGKKRLPNGILKEQYEEALNLLEKTDLNYTDIGRKVGLNFGTIINIQDHAIAEGRLDPNRHRSLNPTHMVWTNEEVDLVFDKVMNKLGKTPTQDEFRKKYSGAYDYIRRGAYDRQITTWYQYLNHRGLSLASAIETPEQLQDLLKGENLAILASIATDERYASDIVDILKQMFPDRIKDKAETTRLLVSSKIGDAVFPFSPVEGEIIPPSGLMDYIPESVRLQLEPILFKISVEHYQPKFNKDPRRTLEDLEATNKADDPFVKDLMTKTRRFYEELFEMEIPGIGKLSAV